MVEAEENLTLGEVHQQRYKIVASALNFRMILFGDSVNAQVDLRAAGHANGHFFAQEEVGVFAEDFRGVNGIVVGQCDHGHAEALAAVVDLGGVVVGLLANPAQTRGIAHPRCSRMNMKVATHVKSLDAGYEQHIKQGRIAYENKGGTD